MNKVTSEVATFKDLEIVFGNVVSVVVALAGIVFLIMLLIGGLSLITAGSEAPKAEAAKKNNYVCYFWFYFCCSRLLDTDYHLQLYGGGPEPI